MLCKAFGPPESLVLEDVPEPVAGDEEVLIDVRAAALNFPDVLMIAGKYQSQPAFPFSPGGEIAGTVLSAGAKVTGFSPGDQVFGATWFGGLAERTVAPAARLMRKPASMSFAEAAGVTTTYGTSYYALKDRANLRPGENLLVLGAAGGVGIAAVQLGKALGARVIAAASTQEKLKAAAEAGADELIDYSDGQLKDRVKALTDGKGADVIYDPVGGDVFDESMRCVNWGGRILTIGFTSGRWPQAPVNLILIKGISVVGVRAGEYGRRHPEKGKANAAAVHRMAANGEIDPYVCKAFPLEHAVQAMRLLQNREAVGKTVVTMNGYAG